ncbi:MAG: M23 family metallopeptidase [Tumebacillaceae bacterium]
MLKLEFWKKKRKQVEPEVVPWGSSYERYPDTTRSSLFAAEDDDWDFTQSKPVFSTRPVEGRPRSYDDFLRARGAQRTFDGGGGGGYYGSTRRFYEDEEDAGGLSLRRGMQLLGAAALTLTLYFTFQSDQPMAKQVQAFVAKSLAQDSDLSVMSAWWQKNVSDRLAVPVSTTPSTSQSTDAEQTIVMPVSGTVKTPYDGTTQQGVTFSADLGAEVKAIAKGTVENVENNGQGDYTVTISHGTQGKAIYRHLVAVNVKKDEWVEPNQKLGTLTQKGDKAELFFAYQRDDAYVDPMDVLQPQTGR